MRIAVLGVAMLVAGSGSAPAQTMRPFTTYRQLHGETRLEARLDFAAGELRVARGRTGELYRMALSYDADRFVPLSRYESSGNAVTLGVEAADEPGFRVVSHHQLAQEAAVELSPTTDLSLTLALGAGEADLDLGGLRVADLRLKTGASRTVVRFSEPNLVRCRSADISAGAAELAVLDLGNSRCDRVRIEGGIGRMTLDFGGTWTNSQQVELSLAVTELRLRLPRSVGVRVTMDRFLASFEPAGLIRAGDAWVSQGYQRADRHLEIALQTAVSSVRVDWIR